MKSTRSIICALACAIAVVFGLGLVGACSPDDDLVSGKACNDQHICPAGYKCCIENNVDRGVCRALEQACTEETDGNSPEGCTSQCAGKCGGPDAGCLGEQCPSTCDAPTYCGAPDYTQCACTSQCAGKCGGPDAGCPSQQCPNTCNGSATCIAPAYTQCTACVPDCSFKACGDDDGCGGKCTACAVACATCNTSTWSCDQPPSYDIYLSIVGQGQVKIRNVTIGGPINITLQGLIGSVTFTATPNGGWYWDTYVVDGTTPVATNPYTFCLDAAITLQARFIQ